MSTWGISGPRFLLLYLALLAVTVLVVALARRRVTAEQGAQAAPDRLDPYAAAYLNGGGALAATTAISSLLRAGCLAGTARRGRWVRLATRSAPPAGAHPVEWAAYQVVAAMLAAAAFSARPVRLAAAVAGRPARLVVLARALGLGQRRLTVACRTRPWFDTRRRRHFDHG